MTVLGGIDRRLLQNVDWPLLGAMGGLVILSATTLASLHIGRAGGNVAFRQLAWFTLGLFALVAVASVDYRRLVRLAPVFFVMGLVGLASVFVLGRTVSGARRWILLGPMSVQPSEVFKLCFVLMATWVLTSRWAQPVGKTTLALTVPVLVVPVALIVKQPDLGTALLLFPVLTALLVGAGIQLRLLGGFALAGLSALPLVWFLAMKEYQRERILVFLDRFRTAPGQGRRRRHAEPARLSPGASHGFHLRRVRRDVGVRRVSGAAHLLRAAVAPRFRHRGLVARARGPLDRARGHCPVRDAGTRQRRNGHRPPARGGRATTADELRRHVHAGLADRPRAPALRADAAVPMRRARAVMDRVRAPKGCCREQAHRRQRGPDRDPRRRPGR